jgi:hypothetical protein
MADYLQRAETKINSVTCNTRVTEEKRIYLIRQSSSFPLQNSKASPLVVSKRVMAMQLMTKYMPGSL